MKYSIINNWTTFLLIGIFLTIGCRKDIYTFTPYPDSVGDIKAFLSQNLRSTNATTTFYFSRAIPDTILTTPNNVRVWLSDTENVFQDENGATVPCSTCNDLKVEVTEYLKKSDMLGNDVTTASDGKLVESGGIINLRITCGNNELRLRPNEYIRVQFPVNSEADLLPNMMIYYGSKPDNSSINWALSTKSVGNSSWGFDPNINWAYELRSDSLGWIGAARVVNDPQSKFCIKLDQQFNDKNTLVYVTFDGKNMIAPTLGNFQNQEFCFENTPIGYPVKIVTISKIGNQWHLGKGSTETGTNTIVNTTPETVTEADLVTYLKQF
jgi:hypothetical protein